MVEYKQTKVYRGDWDFRMDDTEDYFVSDSTYVKNDDKYCSEEHDYMELEDFNTCLELDDAMYELEHELFGLLADRVYMEYDKDNTVLWAFTKAIKDDWNEREDWTDAIDIVKDIKSGRYDSEMFAYYAYLQAEATLENIDLFEFGLQDTYELTRMLILNGIFVDEDEVEFSMPCVVERVDRTDDLEVDVKHLLEKVINNLKDAGETINFAKGYQEQNRRELKMHNTTYKQADLIEEGVKYLFKEDGNVEYVLERTGNTLAITKREWAPDDPKAWENWVELAYMAPESLEDFNLVDLVRDMDDAHEEMEDFRRYVKMREEQKLNGW